MRVRTRREQRVGPTAPPARLNARSAQVGEALPACFAAMRESAFAGREQFFGHCGPSVGAHGERFHDASDVHVSHVDNDCDACSALARVGLRVTRPGSTVQV